MMDKYNNSYHLNQTTLKIIALYANDYLKSLYLRQIARGIGVDVKATRIQLGKLEQMNVLSSVSKGRNREYRLNLQNILALYFMILAETFSAMTLLLRNFTLRKITSEMDGEEEDGLDHQIVVLFGSFAKGQEDSESDVDILQIVRDRRGRKFATRAAAAAARLGARTLVKRIDSYVGRHVDLKVTTEQEFTNGLNIRDPLIREVVSSHVVLKGIEDFCEMMWEYYARR